MCSMGQWVKMPLPYLYINDLVQDCSNSIANALELLQPCTNPLIYGTQLVLQARITGLAVWQYQDFMSYVLSHLPVVTLCPSPVPTDNDNDNENKFIAKVEQQLHWAYIYHPEIVHYMRQKNNNAHVHRYICENKYIYISIYVPTCRYPSPHIYPYTYSRTGFIATMAKGAEENLMCPQFI